MHQTCVALNAEEDEMTENREPLRVLFVCMGNICRSPAAEAVMRKLTAGRGLAARVEIDSAGTLDCHAGNPSDPRMSAAGVRRGYVFDHLARQVRREDFLRFDYVVAMDRDNLRNLEAFRPAGATRAEVSLLLDHCKAAGACEVPDPYYGGPSGFEQVMDLVEKGCQALLDRIVKKHGVPSDASRPTSA